jgi:hypothetical protein
MLYEITKPWAGYKVGEKVEITDKNVIEKALELKVISDVKPSKKEDKK